MVEIATQKQKQAFFNMWQNCFDDSEAFSKWLFEKRFLPDYCTYIQKDGNIVCCMQSYPLHIWVRGNVIKGVMLCGVCTDKRYRKQGLMTELFSHTMRFLREKGFVIAVHTPAVLNSYYTFGHFPVNKCQYIQSENVCAVSKDTNVVEINAHFERLYHCYEQFSQKYSGCISRTMADFVLKMEDYRADGAKVIVYEQYDVIKGYSVFYCTGDMVQAVETVAENQQIYQKIVEGVCYYAKERKLSIKLPEDVVIDMPFLKSNVVEKGVAGILDIQKLMSVLGQKKGYAIAIQDNVIEQNNGVFDLDGSITTTTPDIKLNTANAVQLLLGYCSLHDLEQNHAVEIYHKQNAKKIADFYTKQQCYIIDEY